MQTEHTTAGDNPSASAPHDRAQLRILVVDDQSHVRTFTRKVLQRAGITNVVEAADGNDALTAVTQPGAQFDLILCDLRMPGRDGIETIRSFAALGLESAVAIMSMEPERVLETAGVLADAQGLRMLGTIQKPLTAENLEPVLTRMIELPGHAPRAAAEVTPGDLANAFTRGELRLWYQPKISIRSGAPVGVEALVRWKHPTLGLLGPESFVPAMAEHAEYESALMQFALTEAMSCASRWHEADRDLRVALSLPAMAFDRLDLPDRLDDMARAARVPAEFITLQVEEKDGLLSAIRTLDVMTRLRLKDFSLSIDAFGAGRAGLGMLQKLPFNEMRIDPAFVHRCAESAAKKSVVEASLALARSLQLTSVAVGVQLRSDWDLLASMGCDALQGPFIARPMSEEGVEAWAAQWTQR